MLSVKSVNVYEHDDILDGQSSQGLSRIAQQKMLRQWMHYDTSMLTCMLKGQGYYV